MITVNSEKELSLWFKDNFKKLGYSKIVRGEIARCPDFIMLKDGKEIGVELETRLSNFINHKHDLNSVDEIVCIIKYIEIDKPVKIVEELNYEDRLRKVTLSIDSEVYEKFQNYCEENDIMLSKRVERLIKRELEGDVKK